MQPVSNVPVAAKPDEKCIVGFPTKADIHILTIRQAGYLRAALRTVCSFASSLCESEVLRTLPPDPLSSSITLSGVAFLTRTNSMELPGVMLAARPFIKLVVNSHICERTGHRTHSGSPCQIKKR